MDPIDVNLARLRRAVAVKQRGAGLPEQALVRRLPEKLSQVTPAKPTVVLEAPKLLSDHGGDDYVPQAPNLWVRIRRSFGW